MSFNTIIEKHELVDVWPGKQNAYRCLVLFGDNTKSFVNIPKAECEMLMYLLTIKDKLNERELDKLKDLIMTYGEERFEDAGHEAAIDASGEDI